MRLSLHRSSSSQPSRAGAMALSWTLDKIGPICRAVDDLLAGRATLPDSIAAVLARPRRDE